MPTAGSPRGPGAPRQDGYLFIEGRADDTINRGGENISPAEIEEALATHPRYRDVAVFGVPPITGATELSAVIVPAKTDQRGRGLPATGANQVRSSRTPDRIMFATESIYRHWQTAPPGARQTSTDSQEAPWS